MDFWAKPEAKKIIITAKAKAEDEEGEGTEVHKLSDTVALNKRTRYTTRRAFSEAKLDEVLDWHLEKGMTYFLVTGGDVDQITYLRRLVKTQKVDYAIVSTWTMATADAMELSEWLDRGLIGRLDIYSSENISQTRAEAWGRISAAVVRHGGRAVSAWSHSKVMVVYGDRFDAVVLSSGNLNTNTRVENTSITVDTEVCDFFRNYFDHVEAKFVTAADGWSPWVRNPVQTGSER